jgi:hypothetical protein
MKEVYVWGEKTGESLAKGQRKSMKNAATIAPDKMNKVI